jgi:hypothetical protein
MTGRAALIAGALALTSCATAEPIPVHGATPGFECRNVDLSRFVGQPATPEIGSEMLRASGARIVRWVWPNQAVTMDYSAERLTVRLDSAGRVEGASCG